MDQPTPQAMPRFSHPQIRRVVTGVMLCVFLGALDQTVVIPAVPAIAADLDAFGHLSWIVTAYLLTSTAATPIYGRVSDIFGRRALLLPALVLFIVASVLCALAATMWQLIAARALQGLGGAGLLSMAQAAMADVVAPRERGRYQGYMASMWGTASIAGPVLGGYMTDHLSWRWVFWINVPVGLIAMWLCNRALKQVPFRRQPAQIDVLGAALLIGGVTAWLLMLSWGGTEYPWASGPVMALGLGGAGLVGLLVVQERRVAYPLLPPRLFANAVYLRGVAVAFLTSFALFGATFTLPLLFQLVQGADASESGLLMVPFLASNVAGAFGAGSVARYAGRTKGIVLAGLAAATLGFVLLGQSGTGTPTWLTLLYSVLLGAGIGGTMPSVLMTVQNAAERRDIGVATGTLLFLRSMGGAFGSTVVGAVLAVQFASGLAASGIQRRVDLGELRGHGDALVGLGSAARAVARDMLADGFRVSYLACAGLMLVGIVVTLGLRDVPLRSAEAP